MAKTRPSFMPKSANLRPSLQKDGKLLKVIKKTSVVLSINLPDVFHEDMEYRRVVAAIVFEATGRTCTGITSGPGVQSCQSWRAVINPSREFLQPIVLGLCRFLEPDSPNVKHAHWIILNIFNSP